MTSAAAGGRSIGALHAIIEEAWRRARKRRLRYAAAAACAALVLGAAAALVVTDHPSGQGGPLTGGTFHLALAQPPSIGVSCRLPNHFLCDRVGIGVWLRRPVARLRATIAGRPVPMTLPCGPAAGSRESCRTYCRDVARVQPCGTYFQGFLRPAGLVRGALRIQPDAGRHRWLGRTPAPRAVVRIVAEDTRGRTGSAVVHVPVRAGWG